MKCDEFEKKLLEDPYTTDKQFHEHRSGCDRCQTRFEDVNRMEEKFLNALEQDVDQDFVKKLERQLIENIRQQRRRNRKLVAIAAGVLLMVTSGILSFNLYQKSSLTDFVLAHIDHEIEQLQSTTRVSKVELERYFEKFNSHYLNALEDITYIERCWMRTGFGLHLIFQGRNGPVTLLLMPNESVSNLLMVQAEEFQGKVYSHREGSFALVGQRGEPIEMLAEKLRMAMNSG